MASNPEVTKASLGTMPVKKISEPRRDVDHSDGRPHVRWEAWKKDLDEDPLLEALKEGKR